MPVSVCYVPSFPHVHAASAPDRSVLTARFAIANEARLKLALAPMQIVAGSGPLEGNLDKEAHSLRCCHLKLLDGHDQACLSKSSMFVWCRRLGWISFWAQLALSIVSATILSFAVSSSMQAGH